MTMLQMSNFTALAAHDVIKGITGTKNLFDKDILQRVKKGEIVKIGTEGEFDPELILSANPQVIFISPFKRGGYDAIKETGITLIPHMGYKELDPLGQAEWIKYVAMFIGKEKEASQVFAEIERRYLDMKKKVEGTTTRPTVFSGEMHGGNWYAVGGKNYLAQIFRDAGAEYVMKDDNTGGVPIEYEQMYATAANADYWRILNSYPGDFSYEALKSSEPRNALFKAFKDRHVIYCNMKQTPYYEISPVKPDAVLADLVAIFHPELMPRRCHECIEVDARSATNQFMEFCVDIVRSALEWLHLHPLGCEECHHPTGNGRLARPTRGGCYHKTRRHRHFPLASSILS